MSRVRGLPFGRCGVVAGVLWLGIAGAAALSGQERDTGPARIAVIDVRRILTESQAGREALEVLRALKESKEAEMAEKEKPAAELQDRIENGRLALSEEKQAELQQDLQTLLIELRRAQDDARREFEDRQVAELGAIEERLMPLVEQIGEEQGLTLIFNKFEDSGLLYAAPGSDITDLVMERLDSLPVED